MEVLKQGGKVIHNQGEEARTAVFSSETMQYFPTYSSGKEEDDINQMKGLCAPGSPGSETQTKPRLMEVQRKIYFNCSIVISLT